MSHWNKKFTGSKSLAIKIGPFRLGAGVGGDSDDGDGDGDDSDGGGALDGDSYFHKMKELCQSIWGRRNNSEEFFL